MALTLNGAVTADAREIRVAGTLTDDIRSGYVFRLDDELLRIRNFRVVPVGATSPDPPEFVGRDRNYWIVDRGYEGSTPATHTHGTSVLGATDAYVSAAGVAPPDPFPTEGDVPISRTITAGTGLTGGGDLSANRTLALSQATVDALAAVPTTAAELPYDPTASGLAATDVQAAVDEVAAAAVTLPIAQSDVTGLEDALAAAGAIKAVVRELTSAEILDLFDTPITLVAGVAGKIYCPLSAAVAYNFGTTEYAFAGAGLFIGIPGGVLEALTLDVSVILVASVDRFGYLGAPAQQLGEETANLAGQPMKCWLDTADPTLGDGTLQLTVLYREITVA